jgi:hypothetical protein
LSSAIAGNTRNGARIAKARTLIDLGRFTDVAAVGLDAVPTTFQWRATFSLNGGNNQIWSLNTSAKRWTVGDSIVIFPCR